MILLSVKNKKLTYSGSTQTRVCDKAVFRAMSKGDLLDVSNREETQGQTRDLEKSYLKTELRRRRDGGGRLLVLTPGLR